MLQGAGLALPPQFALRVALPRLEGEDWGVHQLPPGCVLRHAIAADLAAYGAFCRRTFTETYRASHPPEALARHVAGRFGDADLENELGDPQRTVLAVTHEGAWVAYALLRSGAAPAGVEGTHAVEVERFYVDDDWHGRGIATPLMDAVLEAARRRGGDVAWLAVWEQNSRATRFYTRCGFAGVGRATYQFDGHPESDQVMAIRL